MIAKNGSREDSPAATGRLAENTLFAARRSAA